MQYGVWSRYILSSIEIISPRIVANVNGKIILVSRCKSLNLVTLNILANEILSNDVVVEQNLK